jgi:thymidine kinase
MKNSGKLTVIAGPMFSGKTGKLVSMVEVFTGMGYRVLTIKPGLDQRYSSKSEIHSHDHRTSDAIVINGESVEEVVLLIQKKRANKVFIDEAQFFNKQKVLEIVHSLLALKIDVFAAGLLFDYKRQPFGAMPNLLEMADERLELFSICQKCGSIARHSERTSGGTRTIDVGAADKYIAVCETCHEIF